MVSCLRKNCVNNRTNPSSGDSHCFLTDIQLDNYGKCCDYKPKDGVIKCWCCNNENIIKGCRCNNCGEIA